MFEALHEFDKAYVASAASLFNCWPINRSHREEYLEVVISRADPRFSAPFHTAFMRTLTEVNRWMPEMPYRDFDLHPSIGPLLSTSYLFEVVHHYLKHSNLGDWVISSEIYLQILTLLQTLASRKELLELLMLPRRLKQACGLQHMIWAQGEVIWEDGPDAILPSLFDVTIADDRPRQLLKFQGEMRTPHIKAKACDLSNQIHKLQMVQLSGPDN